MMKTRHAKRMWILWDSSTNDMHFILLHLQKETYHTQPPSLPNHTTITSDATHQRPGHPTPDNFTHSSTTKTTTTTNDKNSRREPRRARRRGSVASLLHPHPHPHPRHSFCPGNETKPCYADAPRCHLYTPDKDISDYTRQSTSEHTRQNFGNTRDMAEKANRTHEMN